MLSVQFKHARHKDRHIHAWDVRPGVEIFANPRHALSFHMDGLGLPHCDCASAASGSVLSGSHAASARLVQLRPKAQAPDDMNVLQGLDQQLPASLFQAKS